MNLPYYLSPVSGFFGLQGSGKNLFSSYISLEFAELNDWNIVTSFPLNKDILPKFLYTYGYDSLYSRLDSGSIAYIPFSGSLSDWMRNSHTIYLIDEGGINFSNRDWRNFSKEDKAKCALMRHHHQKLIYCAQYFNMVDTILRELTGTIFHCSSWQEYSRKRGHPIIINKRCLVFTPDQYSNYLLKVHGKASSLKSWWLSRKIASHIYSGRLKQIDKDLFRLYDSFGSSSFDPEATPKSGDQQEVTFYFTRLFNRVYYRKFFLSSSFI